MFAKFVVFFFIELNQSDYRCSQMPNRSFSMCYLFGRSTKREKKRPAQVFRNYATIFFMTDIYFISIYLKSTVWVCIYGYRAQFVLLMYHRETVQKSVPAHKFDCIIAEIMIHFFKKGIIYTILAHTAIACFCLPFLAKSERQYFRLPNHFFRYTLINAVLGALMIAGESCIPYINEFKNAFDQMKNAQPSIIK